MAKIVWDFYSEGYETREIASRLAHDFGIPEEQAERDVVQVLGDLVDHLPQVDDQEGGDAFIWAVESSFGCATVADNGELANCGVFQFGRSRVRVLSGVAELDQSFFLRFQHRAIGDRMGAASLEIRGNESGYQLTLDGRALADCKTLKQMLSRLIELLLSLEHPHKPMLAYCHAGAVSHRGRSILMPGDSGVGKSTLTGFLVAHGFGYLSDDMIAIGEDGLSLLPLPTRLSIKAGSWTILEPLYPALPKLATFNRYGRSARYIDPPGNYDVLSAAAAPSAIVFPAFSEGAPTRFTALRPHQTMIRLLEANVRLAGWDAATEEKLAKFIRFVEQTPAYELRYSELPGAMEAIEDLLANRP
ncbi:MAG: hypothetical protein AW10_00679 [Candidatus Accumulibacter appositus]|uniref:Serine kinase n=2 Tax=Candidatus Accumulibacter TaxID=327159 RepID=A0A011P3N5_9PROT|nr:MAG: hypothetical protein AW10_00679 [Candidatus Accumulibacter appositus]